MGDARDRGDPLQRPATPGDAIVGTGLLFLDHRETPLRTADEARDGPGSTARAAQAGP
jgi:hypothetical protein